MPGQIYEWLADATKRGGSQRSLYTPETTLSRRGLSSRADRRARELAGLGIERGHVVALSLGNVADYFVAMLAISKLDAVLMPIDPANGDRSLISAMRRMPVRAVIRRQRGLDAAPLDYPSGYSLRSRRQLAGAMVAIDILNPPRHASNPPANTEFIVEAIGGDAVERDVLRSGPTLRAIGEAAAEATDLTTGTRLVCVQALTAPCFFDPVILGWLASEAQLVVTGGPSIDDALPLAQGADRVVAVDTIHGFSALARALKIGNRTLDLTPILPGLSPSKVPGRVLEQRLGHRPRELLQVEELGIIGWRAVGSAKGFTLAPGVEISPGEGSKLGKELLVRTPQAGTVSPPAPPGTLGATSSKGWAHSGFAASFTRAGALKEAHGRQDELTQVEGRRASLARIRSVMCEHPRIRWAAPRLLSDADGEPTLELHYVATGETELEDIEEHAVGGLPPFMVPRAFVRLPEIPPEP